MIRHGHMLVDSLHGSGRHISLLPGAVIDSSNKREPPLVARARLLILSSTVMACELEMIQCLRVARIGNGALKPRLSRMRQMPSIADECED